MHAPALWKAAAPAAKGRTRRTAKLLRRPPKNSQNFVFQNDAKGYENFSGSAPQSMFQYAAPQYTPPRKKRGKVVGLVAGVLCAALVFGVGGFFLGRSAMPFFLLNWRGERRMPTNYSQKAQMPQDTGSAEGSFSIEGIHANTTNGERTPLSVEEIARAEPRCRGVDHRADAGLERRSYGNYGGYFFSGGFFDHAAPLQHFALAAACSSPRTANILTWCPRGGRRDQHHGDAFRQHHP